METKYLYGASVQGIQRFIFQTNKLKEIVGASQLVDKIFTEAFKEFCAQKHINHSIKKDNIIISAAGNLKYLLSLEDCGKIVKEFPKYISNYAPGITISQSVVELKKDLKKDIDRLEHQLKIQRNKASTTVDFGFMGLQRARRTGGVATQEGTFDDRATEVKIADREKETRGLFDKFTSTKISSADVPFDLNDITEEHENAWIAVVHADGNGIGLLLNNLGKKLEGDNEKTKLAFSTFSRQLEKATQAAATTAFEKVIDDDKRKEIKKSKLRLPFRPVVLGGDDLTVIIRADLAFEFTNTYLREFEKETATELAFLKEDYQLSGFEKGLTACAGISYVKQSYPFHYAVDLAENLTAEAKTVSKLIDNKRAPSSLLFYKVQASFIEKGPDKRDKTHLAKASAVSLNYGPYFTAENGTNKPTTKLLKNRLALLQQINKEEEGPGIGKFRNWLSVLHNDENKATFLLDRIYEVSEKLEEKFPKKEIIETDENGNAKTIMQDLIILSTL